MHIKEVDEHLDYHSYWHFPPEVHDLTVAAGHRWWQDSEGIADHYPCPPCKPSAQAIAHGSHDMMNLLLRKKVGVVTPHHYEMLHSMMEESWRLYTGHKKRARHVTVG